MKTGLILICVLLLFQQSACSQERGYRDIPKEYNKNYVYTIVPNAILEKAVDVEKYLPKNFKKDGSVDYTKNIQKAIEENKVLRFPAYKFCITGLQLKSNTILIFDKGSELKMIPNDLERYQVLGLTGIENVTLYNPKITGDLNERKSHKGQWGYGIDIRGSRNIQIYSPYVSHCFGDGIVISKSRKGIKNPNIELFDTSNILIKNAYIDHSGRNGISIIGVDGLKIISPIILNTYTKRPYAAIDIEPDNPSYELNNIIIECPFTFNNVKGIMIYLKNFVGSKSKQSNITINDHIDVESKGALNIPELKKGEKYKPLKGIIQINNPIWIANMHPMIRQKSYGLSPKIEINNPVLKNLELKKWKGKNIEKLNLREKLLLHIKDSDNFYLNIQGKK